MPPLRQQDKPTKRRALREATSGVYRDAILAAAERVFGRAGFNAARMAEIGREAGMAAGTLYHYFDSKEEIFRSLMELRATEHLGRIETAVAAERDPAARLHAVVRVTLEYFDEHRAMFALFGERGSSEADVRRFCGPEMDRHHERFLGTFDAVVRDAIAAGVLRADVPAADLVAFLTGAMKGFVRPWLLKNTRKRLAHATPRILDLVLHGMGAPR